MRIAPGTVVGFLLGMNLFLGLAVVAVIAANGPRNPGVPPDLDSAAGGASAAPAPLRNGSFEGLDLDRDGRITLAEAAGHDELVLRFDRADRNRDGKLTTAEFKRVEKLPPPKAASAGSGPRRQLRRDAAAASRDD
jgi:hypothetical protein